PGGVEIPVPIRGFDECLVGYINRIAFVFDTRSCSSGLEERQQLVCAVNLVEGHSVLGVGILRVFCQGSKLFKCESLRRVCGWVVLACLVKKDLIIGEEPRRSKQR